MKFAGTYQIPTYAVPMLEYGDTTGLTDLDIELINGFVAANFPKIYGRLDRQERPLFL